MDTAKNWATALSQWGLPQEILDQAEQSPWIHPPALFTVPDEIPVSPSHTKATEAVPPNGSVLDIGCGGGIAAFACIPTAETVYGVDHQPEMLELFAAQAEKLHVKHAQFLGDWPDIQDAVPTADVVTCHHVVYNVSDIEPFLTALNSHANKRVVIEMPQEHPLASMRAAWKYFWNLDRPTQPTPSMLLEILSEMGINANIEYWDSTLGRDISNKQSVEFMRIRLCLPKSRLADVESYLAKNNQPVVRKVATIWWDK
jgi:SAM-dependent methyltransferase